MSDVHPLIAGRWSPRAFDPAAEVSDEQLRTLLEAARWAPSHGNTQPARFLLGRRGDDTHRRIFETLRRGNRTWAGAASLLLVGAVVTTDERGEIPNTEYGLGLAVENLVLQAVDLGLIAHQMGGFDPAALHAEFAMPADVRPVVVVAVGVHGSGEGLPEDLLAKDARPRTRRPLRDLVYAGTWGVPAPVVSDGVTESPDEVHRTLREGVDALLEGEAITIAPHDTVLTTQQAADVLGISRPTLVTLLEDGEIPHQQLGRHRRIALADLVAYRQRARARRRQALREMTRQADEDGLYDVGTGFVQTR